MMKGRGLTIAFVVLTLLVSWGALLLSHIQGPKAYYDRPMAWLVSFAPAVVGFILMLVYRGDNAMIRLGLAGRRRWLQLLSLFVGAAIPSIAVAIAVVSGAATLDLSATLSFNGLFLIVVWTVGQEIGWRGALFHFLDGEDASNLLKVSLLSGLVWGLWYVPGIVEGAYSSEAPLSFDLVMVFIICVAVSFPLTLLRRVTESVASAVAFRVGFDFVLLEASTAFVSGGDPMLLGRYGGILAGVCACAAVVTWFVVYRKTSVGVADTAPA